jgi:zinc protease
VVTFPNGTRLTVKPTDFRDEQILVSVETGLGELGLSTTTPDPQSLAGFTFASGGLGRLTLDELNRVLSGRIYSAGFALDGDAYRLSGATRPADLGLQMQVLAAYLTDPGLRPAPFEQIKALFPQIIAQQSATPAGAFAIQSSGLLASGDARQTFPSPSDIAGWTNDQLKAGVIAGLAQGPIDITIVGDVTVQDAIAAVGSTFAALPARPAAPTPAPGADVLRFPAGVSEPVRLTHLGPAEQAMAYIAWPTTDAMGDRTESRQLGLLAAVMDLRVTERIREELAITYSPNVGSSSSDVYEGYGSIFASAQVTPENRATFFTELDAIAAALRDTPVSEDELNRARAPEVERLRRSQAGNEYWLGQLSDVDTDASAVAEITGHIADLESVTPAILQALAQRYLDPSKAWRAGVVAASVQ